MRQFIAACLSIRELRRCSTAAQAALDGIALLAAFLEHSQGRQAGPLPLLIAAHAALLDKALSPMLPLQEERGSLVAGVTVGPSTVTPTASEGPSDVTGRIKIKIKTGAKRVRAASTEPGAAAGASDISPGQAAAGLAKASGA